MLSISVTGLECNNDTEISIDPAASPLEKSSAASDSDDWAEGEELEFDEWNDHLDEWNHQSFTDAERAKDLTLCYVWAPLEQPRDIRLAFLHADTSSENDIRVELQTMSLNSPVPYFTVSYAWGKQYEDNSHLSHSITRAAHIFPVSAHLHAALKRIRATEALLLPENPDARIPLWIDALCINQLDIHERSRQVRMMDEIYRCAESTIVWLGEENMEGEFSLIQELQKWQHLPNRPSLDFNYFPLTNTVEDMILSNSDLRKQCSQLLKREWFYRRWTLQEYILSRSTNFLIGKTWLLPYFVLEIAKISSAEAIPAILCQDRYFQHSQRRLLWDNLVAFRHSKCTDTHDYVYALLGISSNGAEICIDYGSPIEDVFVEVARQHSIPKDTDDSKEILPTTGYSS